VKTHADLAASMHRPRSLPIEVTTEVKQDQILDHQRDRKLAPLITITVYGTHDAA
jgi:hypothetical protein